MAGKSIEELADECVARGALGIKVIKTQVTPRTPQQTAEGIARTGHGLPDNPRPKDFSKLPAQTPVKKGWEKFLVDIDEVNRHSA